MCLNTVCYVESQESIVVECMGFGDSLLGFQPGSTPTSKALPPGFANLQTEIPTSLCLWPWASCIISLGLSFLGYKIRY